jgi:hypothetical protein
VYSHYNIRNIRIYFCNINLKHLQHTYETFETYVCNIRFQRNMDEWRGELARWRRPCGTSMSRQAMRWWAVTAASGGRRQP